MYILTGVRGAEHGKHTKGTLRDDMETGMEGMAGHWTWGRHGRFHTCRLTEKEVVMHTQKKSILERAAEQKTLGVEGR